MTSQHFSDGKPAVAQIPPAFILELGKVMAYGEGKYGRDNWKVGTNWSEYYSSAMRHLLAFWDGEVKDPETTLDHLAHAATNIMMLWYYYDNELGNDDR